MRKILLMAMIAGAVGLGAVAAQTDEAIILQGQVTDTAGNPIADAVVEIWQTDVNGNYDHPGDAEASLLLEDFQYFGAATTDADGFYAFRTVKPGEYEPRPVHIHFKVKIDEDEALTSQFYFIDDRPEAPEDSIIVDGSGGEIVFLQAVEQVDADGNTVMVATGNIVLVAGEGSLIPTASQGEGPFYPVVDVAAYDNDLTSTADDDAPVLPIFAECEPDQGDECEADEK